MAIKLLQPQHLGQTPQRRNGIEPAKITVRANGHIYFNSASLSDLGWKPNNYIGIMYDEKNQQLIFRHSPTYVKNYRRMNSMNSITNKLVFQAFAQSGEDQFVITLTKSTTDPKNFILARSK